MRNGFEKLTSAIYENTKTIQENFNVIIENQKVTLKEIGEQKIMLREITEINKSIKKNLLKGNGYFAFKSNIYYHNIIFVG